MLDIWRWPRRILRILNSELTPTQIAIGVVFGMFAGLVPLGPNTVVLLTLALLVRCSFSATLLSLAVFKLIAWPLAPLSEFVGRAVLTNLTALDPVWRTIVHAPVLAWMELPRYVVFGGYVIGVIIAIPIFLLVYRSVQSYRTSFLTFLDERRPIRALQGRERLYRTLQWLVMGGGVRFRDAPPKRGLARVVRPWSLVALPVLAFVIYGIGALAAPWLMDDVVVRGTSTVAGTDVNLESASLNALTGRLSLHGLSVQDPNDADANMMEMAELTGDLGLIPLLSKRAVLNEVRIGEIRLHVKRQSDGSLNLQTVQAPNLNVRPYLEWIVEHREQLDWVQQIWRFVRGYLWPSPSTVPDRHLSDERRDLPPYTPTTAIERLEIGRIQLTLEAADSDGDLPRISMIDVIAQNLAWPVEANRAPIRVGLRAHVEGQPDAWLELTLTSRAHLDPPRTELELLAENVRLADLQALYAHTLPAVPQAGTATLESRLTLQGEQMTGRTKLMIEGLALNAPGEDVSLLGLSPSASNQLIEGISAYATQCPVALDLTMGGTLAKPTFEGDEALLALAKRGLARAGRTAIDPAIRQIDDRLAEMGASSESLFGKALGKAVGELFQDALSGGSGDDCLFPASFGDQASP